MKYSKTIIVSIFILATVLVVVGGITTVVMANQLPGKSVTQPVDSTVIQQYQAREAAYNQLIQDANQKLAKANADLQAMQNEIAQLKQQTAGQQAASQTISVDDASQIAQQASNDDQPPVKQPELVNFKGKTAYEVVFPSGSIYVDAQSGDVLYNGTTPQQITADQAAQIASTYLHNNNVLRVQMVSLNGVPLYRVFFNSGLIVYLDTTGQIIYVQRGEPGSQDSQGGNALQGID